MLKQGICDASHFTAGKLPKRSFRSGANDQSRLMRHALKQVRERERVILYALALSMYSMHRQATMLTLLEVTGR